MRHPTTRPAAALLAAAALVLLASGCGIRDPLNDPALAPLQSETTRSPNEVGVPRSTPPSRSALADASASPKAAIERFAQLYVNWSARTLAEHQRELAAVSVGEASSAEAAAAAHTPGDYELRRSHLANQGQLVAVSPTIPPRPGSYMVVTRERTTGTGLYDQLRASYHLTIATVQRIPGGWAVSQWHPQN